MNALKLSLTILCLVISVLHTSLKACDEGSTTITSTTVNGDGSVTYEIDMCTEYLGLEGSPDAWSLSFFPGTLTVTAFSPATVTTGTGDLYTGVMDDNILRYSTTESFPSNTGTMFCNTYTITVSGQPDMLFIDYHENYGPSCEETITFCSASVDNTTITGANSVGANDYELEFGATLNISTTGTNPPAAGPDDAGMGYVFFSCPPTTALNTPFSQANVLADPCFFGASGNANESDANVPASPFFGSEVWILPTTMDDNCTFFADPSCDIDFGIDTDGDGCIDFGDVFHVTYLPEELCDCTTPDCPAGGPYPDAVSTASLDCEQFNPTLTNTTFTTCHTVTSDANGFLGIIEFVGAGGDSQCFDDALATRTAELFGMSGGSCAGGPISPTTNNAGNSTTFNPEWNGLSPNTDYVICITMTIASACDVNEVCVDFYSQPQPCGTCVMPDCPIGDVPTYADRSYTVCNTPSSSTLPQTNCYTASSDPNGFLGFANAIDDGSPLCFPGDIDIDWELTPVGDCANVIPNPVMNANGVSSGFNPEYSGLSPCTDYVMCITYSTNFPFDCGLTEVCVDYYGLGTNPDCDDSDCTTNDSFDAASCMCVNTPIPPPSCDDSDCTTTDTYNTTTCMCENTPIPPPSCDDSDCTTTDTYNTTTCMCENTPIPPPSCDDNDCTTTDTYNTTTCMCENTPIPPPSCDDNDCTTTDTYNTTTCMCENTPIPPPSCDDNDCTTTDTYNTTTCMCENTPVTPPSCDDNDCTTTDTYNATTCMCENTPIPPPSCDDNDCTTTDTYNTTTCMCENIVDTPPSCDDNDCTTNDTYNTNTCMCENTPVTPPNCDDNDCTTTDTYNTTTCMCENIVDTPPSCDDGDCTTDDTYNTNTCMCENVPVAPPTCDDNDCTTNDTYNTTTCMCEFTPIPPPSCDDNDCTTTDTYNAATCMCENTPIPPPSCDDGDCLTADVYNTNTCMCENNPIAPGSCDDGDCTTDDVYNVNTCMCENTPIPPPSCDDNDCTTDDTYNTNTCMCENTPVTPPNCDDFDCTTIDTYNTTTCMCENTPEPPVSCDDGDCTTDDTYNTNTCMCENTPIPPPSCDDNDCTTTDTYNTTTCMCENTLVPPPSCDDNDCTTIDTYNTTTCMCENVPEPPVNCDDGDCTTDDTYNTNTCMCENTPVTPPNCNDFDCTTIDTYNTATCMCENTPEPPVNCDDGDCTTDDTYNTNTCMCENIPVAPPICDDNDCTTNDAYNTTTCMCEFTPIPPPSCDDNDCTTTDTYNAATCMCENTPIPPPSCDDGDCLTADVYNTLTCMCENNPIAPGSCDDGDCTTNDEYNVNTCMCENTPIPPPSCDDGDCTTDDTYNTNTCMCENTPVTPPNCDDFDCTTIDTYNTATCMCENTPEPPVNCDDGDCTTDDTYNTNTCMCENTPIPPLNCDDSDCSTDDFYNTNTCMCENTPIPPPSCDDGDCTTDDTYNTNTCMCENTPIPPPSCDDGDCLTADVYNTLTCMCENNPIAPGSCDDGDCTTNDEYNVNTCMCENTPIPPPSCDDGDCTTDDTYNTNTCMCENTPIPPPSCDDFDCTTIDTYNTATCMCENTPIPPPSCDDNDCTTDDTYNTNTCMCENTPIPPPSCDDGDCLTADVYNTQTCMCENNPIMPGSCDDGDCTTEDSYNATTCMCENTPIPPPSCDDGDCTTDDTYNTNTCMCENTPIPPPSCDDNDCTTEDTYNTMTCMCENTPLPPVNCDDNDCATEDTYNPVTCMCENTPITVATATISGDATICEGESATLTLNLTGTGPFTVIYQDQNATQITLNGINDGETITVSPTENTVYSLFSVNDAICDGTVAGSAMVTVDQTTVAPNVSCVSSDENSVTFGWAHPTSTDFEYTISIGGGAPSAPVMTTDLSFTQTGLMPGDMVEISVIAISINSCPNSDAITQICEANDCPQQTVTIDNLDAIYCADDTPFALTATPPGGIFSGPGTTLGSNMFDPSIAGTGTILITYEYTDTATGCDYQGSAPTEISQALVAPILNCGTTTANSVEFTWTNTGVTQYEFTYSTVLGGTITQTVNATSYTVFLLDPSETVTASVIALGGAPCGNSLASNEIMCISDPCPDQVVSVDNLNMEYCADDAAFALVGTPTGGTFTGNGVTAGMFDPSTAGLGPVEIIYTYTDPITNCEYSTSVFTSIVQQISAPVVFCMDTGVDFVTFEWSDVGATTYEITVTSASNGVVDLIVMGNTHTENGLAVNENVTISVVAVSNNICGNSAAVQTMCTAQDCPTQTVTIDNLDTQYCGDAASLILQGTPAGGVFSGDGVTGNIFDPADVTGINTTILYTYTDPATACDYTTQMPVTILPPFGVPVVTCGDNTMNSVTFNWTDVGTTLYEVSISINGGTPVNSTTMDLFWTETGLNPSDVVEITVVAVGVSPCSNSAPAIVECSTEDCVPSTATISGMATVCGGETALITFNFVGTGPYDVTYLTNGGTPVLLTGIFDGHTEAVNPTITSNYTIQTATDAGNVNCTVDVNGAATVNVTSTISATVTVTSDFSGTAVSCAGEADGSAEATNPTGGTAPYTYIWSNGQTGATANNLAAGAYELTITDADGCSGTANVLIDEPTAITSDFILESPLCADDNNGWIMATNTTGGSEPYLYSLNGGTLQMQDSFPNLAAGVYEVMVEDANGCIVTSEETLLAPSPVFVDLGSDTLVVSGTELDIVAQTNASNLDTIIWTPFEILDTAFNFMATVTANNPIELAALAIDENGCEGTDNIIIRVSKDRNVFIPNAISPDFDGINDKFIVYGGVGVAKINMVRIFDRWGDMVYQNGSLQLNSSDEAWDGTYDNQMMNDQVLVYYVEILFTDGEVEIFKGDITLMR